VNVRNPVAALWLYTLARVAVFAALFGLLWVMGVRGLLGAAVALVLSVPVSFVVLTKPRAALTETMQARVQARGERTAALDAELSGEPSDAPTQPATDDDRPTA
jgi:hypothetical protein